MDETDGNAAGTETKIPKNQSSSGLLTASLLKRVVCAWNSVDKNKWMWYVYFNTIDHVFNSNEYKNCDNATKLWGK